MSVETKAKPSIVTILTGVCAAGHTASFHFYGENKKRQKEFRAVCPECDMQNGIQTLFQVTSAKLKKENN